MKIRMKFEVYEDASGEYRWRLLSNKKIVADSAEGYKTKAGCKKAIQKIQVGTIAAEVEEI